MPSITVSGSIDPLLSVVLNKGESIFAERNAMVSMDATLALTGRAKGGFFSAIRVTAHKSCALAAQTFMIAMANEGYDTCPLEGLDSRRLKRTLKLPHDAEINMAIPCGIRDGNKGIWGERCRVPFEDVYRKL